MMLPVWLAIFAGLFGLGTWLLLPRRILAGRSAGAVLMTAAVAVLGSRLVPPGETTMNVLFYALAALTVGTAIGAMTFRSPVYCAIWFAISVLATAGLFLIAGAQFIGIAMVVVYAGAIVVMFLFVLMLAQPEGMAFYDRLSFEPLLSAIVAAVLLFMLTICILTPGTLADEAPIEVARQAAIEAAAAEAKSTGEEAKILAKPQVLGKHHVAAIGQRLFGEHLIAVQVIGVLLFTAIVAAAAIASDGRPTADSSSSTAATAKQEVSA